MLQRYLMRVAGLPPAEAVIATDRRRGVWRWHRRMATGALAAVLAAVAAQPAFAGSLAGSTAAAAATVNLTTEGSSDWIHWGRTSVNTAADRKAGVTPQLSNWSPVGGANPTPSASAVSAYAWSDGTPLASSAGDKRSLRLFTPGRGLSFTAPADTSSRTLKVYVGAEGVKASLTAALSDGSAPQFTTLIDAPSSRIGRVITLVYQANSAGQTLQVSYTIDSQYAAATYKWASFESAALQGDIAAPATVATPIITPNGGTFADSVQVSLASATAGASIFYTTNGNTPTPSSTLYGAPFTLTQSATVKAIGIKSGLLDSAIASATFTRSSSPPPSGGNIIPNASMEENTKWVFPALGGYSASQANTGARSIYLVNNGSATATSGFYQATQTRIPNVVPGQEYVANVWVKGQEVVGKDNSGGNAPLLVLRFRNAAGSYMDFVDSAGKKHVMEGYNWAPLGTYNWNKRTLHLQAPANAAMLDVSFRSWFWCISGTTFWDDASFAPRVVAGRGALLATYQAETANTRSGGILAVDAPDFTGTGYFDVTTNNAVLEWTNVQGGGSRVIAMRYAWEGAGKQVELLVNGVSQGKKSPVMTGRRGFWATENWTVNMPNATNTVRLVVGKSTTGTEKIQPQVDRLEVYAAQ